jgi:AraC-like DNA-binding protein
MLRSGETAVDKHTVASGFASAIGACASQYGIDIKPICSALQLDTACFSDLTGRISLDRICRLMETCALIANDEAFGLKTAGFYSPGATGPFGFGLISAPTALDYIRFLAEHQHYATETSYSKFTINETGAELAWTFSPLIIKREQFVDLTFGILMGRMRQILGTSIDQMEVGLERVKPKNSALFREKLSRKLSFERRLNSVKLPPDCYNAINPNGDERLYKLMDLQCRALKPQKREYRDFMDEIKDFLLVRITESNVSLAQVAAYFHVSERTLQRRLSEVGSNLNDLRDCVRRDLAEKLLNESNLSASEIAARLGYSAPSAFSRSTVRWFGKSPREFRRSVSTRP